MFELNGFDMNTQSPMPKIEDYINAIKSPQDNLNKLKRFRPFLYPDGSMDFWFNEDCVVFHMIDSLQDNYEFGLECCLTDEYFERQRLQNLSVPNNDVRIYETELKIPGFSSHKYIYPVILHRMYIRRQSTSEYVSQEKGKDFAISKDGKTLLYWKMPSGIIGKSYLDAFIPEGVEIIADGAFAGCGNLDSLYLPKSLKKIGRGAFMCCGALKLYLESEHIEAIDEYAFWGCRLKMRSGIDILSKIIGKISMHAFANTIIHIKYNEEYKVQRIKKGEEWSLAFYPYDPQEWNRNNNPLPNDDSIWNEAVEDRNGVMYDKNYKYVLRCNNKNLIKYTIKESAIGILPDAFGSLKKITEIELSQVKHIGASAFNGCESLKHIKFGSCIQHIGEYAFAGTSIENLILPKSVSYLGYRAFGYCENLSSVEIMSSIDTINPESFRDCKLLNSVSISDSVVSIERMAFANCISLQKVHLSKHLIKIGELAFCNCAIKEIELPKSLLHMEYSPFSGCYNTKIHSKSPLFCANDQFLLGYNKTRLISYLANEINLVIPGTVKVILGYSLTNKNKNAKIYLPNSVNVIGHWAFRYARAKQINFPRSITFVKTGFDYCTSIELYIIDESKSALFNDSVYNSKILRYSQVNF